MRNAVQLLFIVISGLALGSCNVKNPLVDDTPVVVRILAFSFAQVPDAMSDENAMIAMRNNSGFFVSANSHAFPTTDSLFGRRMNRVIVTAAGSSHSGSTQLFGGQDVLVHPATTNGPISMSISVTGVDIAGETGTFGVYELFLEEIGAVGSGTTGGPMEFKLESINTSTTEATGSFMFVGHVLSGGTDTRRWAVKGSFTLRST